MAQTRRVIDLPDGRGLAIVEAGDPDGAPVFVHHGTPGCGDVYRAFADDARARGIRLIGYDRAGYGESDRHAARTGELAEFLHDSFLVATGRGVDAHITRQDGHLTLGDNHIGEVHAWLLERF